jgi:N-acetyl-S-(2-succino)cysteine monooxygenase
VVRHSKAASAELRGTLDDFVELVVPELQRRGLHRTNYPARTLRGHLSLPRPAGMKPGNE